MGRRAWTRSDTLVIAAALALAALLWVGFLVLRPKEPAAVVVVNVMGTDAERIPLTGGESVRRTVRGFIGNSTFEISGGRVRMLSSDCPDKVCIRMGWAAQPGQVIVCLPNRVVLKVESK
ncbi:MAG: NusG domain II-containing protein [Firmicutes bacterium]|nr:NusG domain II-containing protein [Bacillota bacterium]